MSDSALPSSESQEHYIVVRFSDVQIEDLPLCITNVPTQDINTKWLRQMCRQLRGRWTQGKRLKFIRSGRLLNSHSDLGLQQFFQQGENDKYYVHCIVGETLSANDLANEDVMDDVSPATEGTTSQAIGFDRLRSVGFSDEEIELLRQQFRSTYGDLEELSRANNEARDIRQLEEQWMETGATEDAEQFNSVGIANYKHNIDLLIGLIIGCVLGVFSLLLFKQEGLFNKRQKMAIVAGLLFNFTFGILRRS